VFCFVQGRTVSGRKGAWKLNEAARPVSYSHALPTINQTHHAKKRRKVLLGVNLENETTALYIFFVVDEFVIE